MRRAALAGLVLTLLAGCATTSGPPVPSSPAAPATPVAVNHLPRLPPNGRFDDQVGGAYAPRADVAVVERDWHDAPVRGRFNICYLDAFQSQPEDAGFWTGRHPDLLVRRGGRPLTDPRRPGEHLLDTSTAAKRDALLAIVGPWLDGCAASGFAAVDADHLDSWVRSRGMLTRADNLAFVALLAGRAHLQGMAIAQKNAGDLGDDGRTVGFDLAITEDCQVHDACAAYTAVYGDQVVEIEYTDNPRPAYEQACRARGSMISVILRDRDVVPRGRTGYAYAAC